ncbi:hypothetical protein [Frondihabitans australicus]|uniref:Uncharacterized protein n=1 Tax=Frondihabitans australicus TaxID=386892 RepID=A0A495IIN4_9MICO|nr:hypothetical protein [Frondihabitans australicus]RKR75258.1 hypothetical protein C8E83_2397 [Frondihabitans australicus]
MSRDPATAPGLPLLVFVGAIIEGGGAVVCERDEHQRPEVDWVAVVTMLATVASLALDVVRG